MHDLYSLKVKEDIIVLQAMKSAGMLLGWQVRSMIGNPTNQSNAINSLLWVISMYEARGECT
jgi:hypothetical protein